jgi:predicted TIM-barrel fold metal-dependent hydrolase
MGIDFTEFQSVDYPSKLVKQIEDSYKKGARGIKLWKFISLGIKDKNDNFLRLDDGRINAIFTTAARLQIPVLMHVADPTAFFKVNDCKNERWEELNENPDWNFHDPKFFSFNELMNMQDNVIERNPDTTFIVAHFGSFSENLAHVGKRLDRYPNMYIDMAARLAELGRQPYSSRDFFIKYQDRILFGSDFTPLTNIQAYQPYFRFLETKDEYFDYQPEGEKPGQGRWKIYGINLPDEVLKKVYYNNAASILKLNSF